MSDVADELEVYLVGGAVRDRLLGWPVADRDWVVVGSTPQQMLALGFHAVGSDFPVFLHPHSNEAYALARQERKIGSGYHGFEAVSNPTISLEQDLLRRDLTINAIAQDRNGNLIDPFGGVADLQHKRLRHVSAAFAEDPVRVLRTARFSARLQHLGFAIDADTAQLMRQIVLRGEVDALTAERVWQELQKAMQGRDFSHFIRVLRHCGALAKVLPEVDALFGVPQTARYHPEIDTGVHVLMSLDAAQQLTADPRVIFAVLVHDLGKGVTPAAELPSHRGHEHTGLPLVRAVCRRLRVPKKYRRMALAVCELHLHHHRFAQLRPTTMLKLLERLNGFREPQNVADFCLACSADLRGRTGSENMRVEQTELVHRVHRAAQGVDAGGIAAAVMQSIEQANARASAPAGGPDLPEHAVGERIATAIYRARLSAIRAQLRADSGPSAAPETA